MDIRQLKQFLAVLEEGSLGRAAAVLNISEPALSKSIRELERTLQVRLMDRYPKGMSPTVFGLALAEHAKIIRAELTHAVQYLNELKGTTKGHVAIGTGPSYARSILPAAITRLLGRRQGVHVTVHEGLTDKLLPGVLTGELDFVIMTLNMAAPDPKLVFEPGAGTDRYVVVGHHGHPLANGPKPTLGALLDYPWVLARRQDRPRHLEQVLAAAGVGPLKPAIETGSYLFVRNLLRSGDFLSYLPEILIEPELQSGELVMLDMPETQVVRDVGFVFRKRASQPPLARILMNEIGRVARDRLASAKK